MPTVSHIPFSGHNKLSAPPTGPRFSLMARAAAGRLATWFDLAVPEGYEDETGFHLAATPPAARRTPLNDSTRRNKPL